MNNETWKVVRGYEGLYEVSDLGRIRSLGRECASKCNSRQKKHARILAQEVTVHGYCRVRLYDKDGKASHYAVHRLVLEAFVGVSEYQINHKNEIKTDNRLENLEYCDAKYNCNYGGRNEKISANARGTHTKGVVQIDESGTVIQSYPSRSAASEATGVSIKSISRCCALKRKTAGGYVWRNN